MTPNLQKYLNFTRCRRNNKWLRVALSSTVTCGYQLWTCLLRCVRMGCKAIENTPGGLNDQVWNLDLRHESVGLKPLQYLAMIWRATLSNLLIKPRHAHNNVHGSTLAMAWCISRGFREYPTTRNHIIPAIVKGFELTIARSSRAILSGHYDTWYEYVPLPLWTSQLDAWKQWTLDSIVCTDASHESNG